MNCDYCYCDYCEGVAAYLMRSEVTEEGESRREMVAMCDNCYSHKEFLLTAPTAC